MKTYRIELQRVKSMAHNGGMIEIQIDAAVQLAPAAADGRESSTRLALTEETARVLQTLLKSQLTELDRRKGRSQR